MGTKKITKEQLQEVYIRLFLGIESLNKISKDFAVSQQALDYQMKRYEPIHQYIIVGNDIVRLSDQKKFKLPELPELHQKFIKKTLNENGGMNEMLFIKF